MSAPRGYLCLLLHAHLPFVRHPEYEHFLEENWYYEAVADTYLPILEVLEGLDAKGVNYRLTMTLTPSLVAMFDDPLLRGRLVRYFDQRIALARSEEQRLTGDTAFGPLATFYRERFERSRERFVSQYGQDLTAAFRGFQDRGHVEIVTCAATHGFLPLLGLVPSAVRAQIRVAVDSYRRAFGRDPRGMWLPECAYAPGLDKMLADEGLRFFVMESHGLLHAKPRPRFGLHAPVYCPSGVVAFGRDIESSKQVWSAIEGYPGDFNYREYYRDVGFDLPVHYIRGHLPHLGPQYNTGIKYFRITGRTNHKEPYIPAWARERAAEHAGNFLFNRQLQINYLAGAMDRPPIVVAPYDAELFGHWWFEGPMWMDLLFRKLHFDQNQIEPITPSEYLDRHPTNQVVEPGASSWGHNGYYEVWLNGTNDWIYRHLHHASRRMEALAACDPGPGTLQHRATTQALRELLLAQASDWAFIMKTGTMVPYALKRTTDHLLRFLRLADQLEAGAVDEAWLRDIEARDNCFPDLDVSTAYRAADESVALAATP
ncbi:MAG: 1,4-alpha-glucan branching protein domain-containing protein [Nitrospirota bacterium]